MISQPIAAPTLDVDGAIQAASMGSLARGLIIAGLLTLLACWVVAAWASRRRSAGTTSASSIPLREIVGGAGGVIGLGGILGIVSSVVNYGILSGPPLGGLTTSAGLVFVGATIVGAAFVVLSLFPPLLRRNSVVAIGAALSVGALIPLALMDGLPRPERSAEAVTTISDTVQATVLVSPAAEGANTVRVGFTGPDEDVQELLDLIGDGTDSVGFVSLVDNSGPAPVPLSVIDGALVATNVLADGEGRWRVQITIDGMPEPIRVDVTLQPNPGARQ